MPEPEKVERFPFGFDQSNRSWNESARKPPESLVRTLGQRDYVPRPRIVSGKRAARRRGSAGRVLREPCVLRPLRRPRQPGRVRLPALLGYPSLANRSWQTTILRRGDHTSPAPDFPKAHPVTTEDPGPDARAELLASTLSEEQLDPDPLAQLESWLREAREAKLPEWNAMTLATVDSAGAPAARIVLLKGTDQHGVRFFTNYESDKGRQLKAEPRAALVLFWPEIGRQVRIVGATQQLPAAESDAYYASRSLESRLGAWASPQSKPLASRADLEEAFEAAVERFKDSAPDRPPHWGGFRLTPTSLEFWKSGAHRLHDRFRYTRESESTPKSWRRERLAP